MPALLTHYLCGDAVIKSIDKKDIKDTTNRYRKLFNLGTQGPDVFFYHNALPWVKGESLSKVGSRLHDEKVKPFFKNALEAIDRARGEGKQMILSYMYGYVCHHSLDIHAHPYIFYKAGFAVNDGGDKKKYDAYHRRLEAEIDVLMAKKILKKSPKEIPSHEIIKVGKDEAEEIAKMYNFIFKNIFNMDMPVQEIQRAVKDMATITKAFRDPLGIKKPIVAFAEKWISRYNLISNMIYPKKVEEAMGHLNLDHSPWHYPWDKSSPQFSSFCELFNEAVEEAKVMCRSINEYINGVISEDKVLDVLGNRSFSSGLDCDEDLEFKYYDLIYKYKLPVN